MVTRFCGAANLYSKTSHRPKKSSSTQAMTEQLKGIKTFWNWLKRIKDLSNKEQDDVLKSRSGDETAPLMNQMIGGVAPQRNVGASMGRSSPPASMSGATDASGTFSSLSILSDGIAGLLHRHIEFKKLRHQSKEVYESLDQESEKLYGFRVFTSQIRQKIIDFCGWTDVIRPRHRLETEANQQAQH